MAFELGVQMFKYRQSSDIRLPVMSVNEWTSFLSWMHFGLNVVTGSMDVHALAGSVRLKRSPLTGGVAYGMPRNVDTDLPNTLCLNPRTWPYLVDTTMSTELERTGILILFRSLLT